LRGCEGVRVCGCVGVWAGECLGLEWSDFNGEYLNVTKSISKRKLSPTKTGATRRTYVPIWARSVIGEYSTRFSGGYILQNSLGGFHCDTDRFNARWKRAHSKARIPYRIPYACRHTRAAELLSAGVSPARAAQQLGHSVLMFLNIYSEFIEAYADQDMSDLEGVSNERSYRKEKD